MIKENCFNCSGLREVETQKVYLPICDNLLKINIKICLDCHCVIHINNSELSKIIKVLKDKKLV